MFAWKTDKIEKYRTKGRIAAALVAAALAGEGAFPIRTLTAEELAK